MKNYIKTLIIALILLTYTAAGLTGQETAHSKDKKKEKIKEAKIHFSKAKELIYKKDWQEAAEAFRKVAEEFEGEKWEDDSYYWLAFSLNKAGKELKNVEKALELREDALKSLTRLYLRFPSSKWAKQAKVLTMEIAQELAQHGLKEYKKYITEEDEEDEELIAYAVQALMQMDKDKAFAKAEKMLRSSKNQQVREQLLFVIAQSRDPRALPLLLEMVKDDLSPEMRAQVIHWIGHFSTPKAYNALLKLYRTSDDFELKSHIIGSISRIGGEKAVKELIRIYKKEKNIEVKKQILFWLGQNKNKEAQDFILSILEAKRP